MSYSVMECIMNYFPNWQEIFNEKKINITIKDNLYLLKYGIDANFSDEIVNMSRGSIFAKTNNGFKCVCAPFYKFGNYGESYVKDIDWKTASVQEKVDGSLIKIWYYNDWHVSTSKTIDANEAIVNCSIYNFYDIFEEACNYRVNELFDILNKDYTYMFELVSPKNTLTVIYPESKLYFIGLRNNITFQEEMPETADKRILEFAQLPKRYNLYSLDECIDFAQTMTKQEEGFVVCDAKFNRIKIKSPEFLTAFHYINNGNVTIDNVIDAYLSDYYDDYYSYLRKEQKPIADTIYQAIQTIKSRLHSIRNYCIELQNLNLSRQDYATSVCAKYDGYEKDYCFRLLNNADLSVNEFFISVRHAPLIEKIKKILEEK